MLGSQFTSLLQGMGLLVLVLLQHPGGVEFGSLSHLLHMGTRLGALLRWSINGLGQLWSKIKKGREGENKGTYHHDPTKGGDSLGDPSEVIGQDLVTAEFVLEGLGIREGLGGGLEQLLEGLRVRF